MTETVENRAGPVDLAPFVPQLTLRWLRDHPERRWTEVDGTLAFVDISGFTTLSERLSALGKAGAEELTDVIDSRFALLLAVAYEHGGGLLKFGGDALLLLFSGDDHGPRAARAAFEMRALLRTIGRVRTAAGSVNLKMHVGIHTGAIHCFLVGDSHRELIVTGPAATTTVDMEGASAAGDILISPDLAATLPANAVGAAAGPGLLLRAKPRVAAKFEPAADSGGIAIEQAIPRGLRTQLLEAGPLEGEHRQCCVAFIHFDGTDELVGREGADAAAEALHTLVRTTQKAADDHGVTFLQSDIDRDGGKLILLAGAPQAHEDNEERLLRTVRAIVDSQPPLQLHVGVSRGRIFAGQVGFRYRRTYTAMGDTMALAARLMSRAKVGEILVAEEVFVRARNRFDGVAQEPFAVKGLSAPVRAVTLGALRDGAGEDVARVPFVGRESELTRLRQLSAEARAGSGALVELVGEAGIGKSRLADELRTEWTEAEVLTVRCEQYEAATPHHTWRPLLHTLLGIEFGSDPERNRDAVGARLENIAPELIPWASLLAGPLGVDIRSTPQVDDLDPAFLQRRLNDVAERLLAKLLASPTLLLFEDAHWMDDASAALLRHISTRLSSRPWLICTTRRPLEGGFAATEIGVTVELEPLAAADAQALVEAAAGRVVSVEAARALAERGAGNPLFLQELAVSTVDAVELPETIEALLAARIDMLAPGERALLRWASVLGVSFSGSLIAEILFSDDVPARPPAFEIRLDEFVEPAAGLPDTYRFRHALVRDVAYAGLSFRRRRELHGLAAEAIERRHVANPEEATELLSLHFLRAGRWERAWQYSLEAAGRAQGAWANVEAAEFYRRALESARQLPGLARGEVAAVWESLGDSLKLAGSLDAAVHAYSQARRVSRDQLPRRVALMNKEGKVREDMGKYSDATRWYARGLRTAQEIEENDLRTHLELELSISYAEARFRQGAFDDSVARCREIIEKALAADEQSALARAYMMIYGALTATGSPERVAFRGLALPIFEELDDLKRQATTLNNLGIDAYFEGDWDKALDVYERARELFERIGDVTSVAMATNNIGEILSDQGHLSEATELFVAVQRAAESAGHRLFAEIARLNLGRVAARAGRYDEADSQLSLVVDAFREIRADFYVLETQVRVVESLVLRGAKPEEALTQLEDIFERTTGAAEMAPTRALVLRLKAALLAQLGRRDEAATAFAESAEVAKGAGVTYEQALALDGLALLNADDDAAAESRALLESLRVESITRPPLEAAAA